MARQLGERDAQSQDEEEGNKESQRRCDSSHRGDDLDRQDQAHRRRDVRDPLHQHFGEPQDSRAQFSVNLRHVVPSRIVRRAEGNRSVAGVSVKREIGHDFADERCELESMAGKAGGEEDVVVVRVPVENEIFVRGHGVETIGNAHDSRFVTGRRSSQPRQKRRRGLDQRLLIAIASSRHRVRIHHLVAAQVFCHFDTLSADIGEAVEGVRREAEDRNRALCELIWDQWIKPREGFADDLQREIKLAQNSSRPMLRR